MSAVLEVQGLSKSFGGLMAVMGVGFTVQEGEIFGLIGPNGAGKTTLFNMLTGLTRPSAGTVRFQGRDITGADPAQVARLGMARTFQNIRLFAGLSVLDNVRVPLHATSDASFWGGLFGSRGSRAHEARALERARELVAYAGLAGRMDAQAGSLSYGERRRLEIARALALSPKLLLLDEPAAGLNPSEKQDLSRFILDIRDRFGLTVLFIEHNVPMVMGLCRSVAVLNFGELIAVGAPDAVQADPAVIEAYLGESDDA
ncbi:Lipopolysaccharide export system ATP-binding protein LptB [Fundidesulfovibrio magnetotacticus]|uniref:Lipopolysaccharide export system ATP-binding protein LptB n=1 Tax=Fundidesulfovibrio magnetotacticus TaxID=2730080 RepID=A0A6V8LS77_9BACT|nr:ABC transporter ATP-binding protein [Fundidesulfovibrio magnetotacticus]GFK92959.1 Lipopolysaccharide export system ATP-binding protein LptB [Fundidesulfovibrio magnetotacticus]